jgi:hypothetical protein
MSFRDVRDVADILKREFQAESKYIGSFQRNQVRNVILMLMDHGIHSRLIAGMGKVRAFKPRKIIPNFLSEDILKERQAGKLKELRSFIYPNELNFFYAKNAVSFLAWNIGAGSICCQLAPAIYLENDRKFGEGLLVHEITHAEQDATYGLGQTPGITNMPKYLGDTDEAKAHTAQILYYIKTYGKEATIELVHGHSQTIRFLDFQRECLLVFIDEIAQFVERSLIIPLKNEDARSLAVDQMKTSQAMQAWVKIYSGRHVLNLS